MESVPEIDNYSFKEAAKYWTWQGSENRSYFFFFENENRGNFICEKSVEVCKSALNYVECVSESVLFCFGLFFFKKTFWQPNKKISVHLKQDC